MITFQYICCAMELQEIKGWCIAINIISPRDHSNGSRDHSCLRFTELSKSDYSIKSHAWSYMKQNIQVDLRTSFIRRLKMKLTWRCLIKWCFVLASFNFDISCWFAYMHALLNKVILKYLWRGVYTWTLILTKLLIGDVIRSVHINWRS